MYTFDVLCIPSAAIMPSGKKDIYMKNKTIENALYNYARNMLPKLRKSYGTECHAWVLQECKDILTLAENYDIQNGTEFSMLSNEIKKIEDK